jgi:hypothetical protein
MNIVVSRNMEVTSLYNTLVSQMKKRGAKRRRRVRLFNVPAKANLEINKPKVDGSLKSGGLIPKHNSDKQVSGYEKEKMR